MPGLRLHLVAAAGKVNDRKDTPEALRSGVSFWPDAQASGRQAGFWQGKN